MAILRATLTAYLDQGPTGDTFPVILEWSNTTGSGQMDLLTLPTNTDITLSIPTGTTLVCLIPPPTNTTTWVIKGAGGDTGISPRTAQPTIYCWNGTATTILRAASPGMTMTVAYL